MYEELVKRLRETSIDFGEVDHVSVMLLEAADAIEELSAKVNGLQFYVDNISKLPDCNTCMKKPMCEFMPKYGEYCRINCPAWLGEPEPPNEET